MADNDITDGIGFENLIEKWTPAEQFLARRTRAIEMECKRRATCNATVTPQFTRKQIAYGAGGVGGLSILVNLILYIAKQIIENPNIATGGG